MKPPVHVILGPEGHGVRVLAAQLADATGATTVHSWADAAGHARVHAHVTDRLADPIDVRRLAAESRLTLTLHDLPQPTDGATFARRRRHYRELIGAADGWAVSSAHERRLVEDHLGPAVTGLVAPLPVIPPTRRRLTSEAPVADWPESRTIGIFGFLYPAKGHRELIETAATLPRGEPVSVLALGGIAPGHDDLATDLTDQARAMGVDFHITGHLDDAAVDAALRRVDVGFCGHRNVSASGSTNHWVAAGRRPLVRDGRYARELSALRPGCYRLFSDDDLRDHLMAVLAAPAMTWLDSGVDTRPHLTDTARRYLDWWAGTTVRTRRGSCQERQGA